MYETGFVQLRNNTMYKEDKRVVSFLFLWKILETALLHEKCLLHQQYLWCLVYQMQQFCVMKPWESLLRICALVQSLGLFKELVR